jgi:hypothetical protein
MSEVNPFQACHEYINHANSVYMFSKNWKDKFNDTLRLMFDTVQTLEKNEELKDFSYTPIEECLNFLRSMTVEKMTDDNAKQFIKHFIYLAYNLNENLEKYQAVKDKIAYLQRYCDDSLTFSESISLMRTVTKRVERWREWLPPSFRLSGHYYNLIKED